MYNLKKSLKNWNKADTKKQWLNRKQNYLV